MPRDLDRFKLLRFGNELGPVYIIPFSYENGMEMLSYENGIV